MLRSAAITIVSTVVLALLASLPLAAQADQARDDYNFAAGLYDRGLHDRAAKAFEGFVQKWPNDGRIAKARLYLGQSLLELGRLDEAIRELESAAKGGDPATAGEARFRAGAALQRRGKNKEAVPFLEAAVAEAATDERRESARYFLAEAQNGAGDKAAALTSFNAQLAAFPNGRYAAFAALAVGYLELDAGKLERALAGFQRAGGSDDPELALEARVMTAETLLRQEKAAEALKILTPLAAKGAGAFDVQVRSALVRARLGGGELDGAMKAYKDAEASNGDPAERARLGLQLVARLRDEKRPDDAAKILATIPETPETHADLEFWRALTAVESGAADAAERVGAVLRGRSTARRKYVIGDALSRRGKFEEAVAAFSASRRESDDPALAAEVAYAEAFAEHRLGRFDRAIALLTPLAKTRLADDLAADVLFALGENHFARRAFVDAGSCYAPLAEKIDGPHGEEALYKLAWCRYQAKAFDEAVLLLGRLIDARPEGKFRVDATYLAGKCHEAAGRGDEAKRAFATVADAKGADAETSARARFGVAVAARKSGDVDAAVREYERVATTAKDKDLAADARLAQADALFDAGRFDEADRAFAQFAKDHGTHARSGDARLGRAWALREKGDVAGAARLARELVESAEGAVPPAIRYEARYLWGLSLAGKDAWKEVVLALEGVEQAPEGSRRVIEARLLRGLALARLGEHARADLDLAPIAAQTTDKASRATALYERSFVLRAQKLDDQADTALATLVTDFPESTYRTDALFRIGEAAYARKDFASASKLYAAVLDRPDAKGHADKALYKSAWCRRELGDAAASAAAFDAVGALEGSPLAAEACYLAGEEYEKTKNFAAAARSFGLVATRQSDHELVKDAALRRVLALAAAGDHDAVIREGPQAAAAAGADPARACRVRSAVGDAFFAKKSWAQARTAYKSVTQATEGPLAARAQHQIGASFLEAGQADEAIDEFLKTTILYAHPEWAAKSALAAGDILLSKGLGDRARRVYEDLRKDYPATEEAKVVPSRLAKISGKKDV